MKKIVIVSILSIIFVNAINAQKITELQALEKARNFMKDKTFSNKEMSMTRALTRGGNNDNDAFYIFNADKDNGFVIVSGDERTEEILGYSDKGNIDLNNLPENLHTWLHGYEEQISELDRNINVHKISKNTRVAVEPLLQTSWYQNKPYNWMCPEVDGENCFTGCVATAMAQVLYYYKCPQEGTPEIPGYKTASLGIELPALPPTTFEWDKIKKTYGTFVGDNIIGPDEYSKEEGDAVAKLMRYCGQAVEMNYTLLESGALLKSNILQQYFGFSKTAKELSRRNYSTYDWEDIIYKEVSEGRPVIYGGNKKYNQGHLFVCDGYDGKGFFHINWGWGKGPNGYYLLSILDPSYKESYNGFSSEGFSNGQGAIIGLKPRTENENEPEEEVKCYVYKSSYGLINYKKGENRKDCSDNFDLKISAEIYKDESCTDLFVGDLAYKIYKNDNLFSTCFWELNTQIDNNGNERHWIASFGANWDDGEYKLIICYVDPDGQLQEAKMQHDLYAIIEGKGLGIRFSAPTKPEKKKDYVINSIDIENSPLIVNKEAEATISLTNTGESFVQHLKFFFGDYEYALTDASAYLDPGQTGTIRVKFTPNFYGKRDIEVADQTRKIYGKSGEKEDNPNYHPYYKGSIYAYPRSNLYLSDCYVVSGGESKVSVYLDKKDCDIKKTHFSLTLPEGITILSESVNNQNSTISKNGNDKWDIAIDQINTDNSTELLSFTILADDKINHGDYCVILDDIEVLSTDDEQLFFLPAEANKIRVGSDNISSSNNIHLTEAGSLSYYIRDKYDIEELKITGEINGTDLRLIRDMAGNNCYGELTNGKLKVLDISEARIVAGGEKYLETNRIKSREPNSLGFSGNFHCYVSENDTLPLFVFYDLIFTDIKLPETLKCIKEYALGNCNEIKKLSIPIGVTNFHGLNLKGLEKLIIPSSIKTLSHYNFDLCDNLKTIVLCTKEPMRKNNNWDLKDVTWIIPRGTKDRYQNNDFWKDSNLEEKDFVTIKADDKRITIGDTIPQFTYTVEGGTLDGEPHFYCEADSKVPGIYEIKIRQGTISNDYVLFENGTLTITPKTFKLTYIVDGVVYKEYEKEFGATIIPETEPVKEGYTFSGWSDVPEKMPAYDVTVSGTFSINKYKLIYKVDGEVYKQYDVEYEATITPEAAPTKEGYTFSGWSDIPETMPAHDVTITGSFTQIKKADPDLAINSNEHWVNPFGFYVTIGQTYNSPKLINPHGLSPITWTSSHPEVATVGDNGVLTLQSAGSTQIKATFAGNNEYNAGYAEYSLIVLDGYKVTSEGTVTLTGGNQTGEVTIETTVNINGQTYKVTAIGENAFNGNTQITTVTIPDGISVIGANAFSGCINLLVINIGKSVSSIGNKAFANVGTSSAAKTRGEYSFIVNCYAESVPQTASDAFEDSPITSGTLLVNDNIVDAYKTTSPWSQFGKIQGFQEAAGIDAISIDNPNAYIYDMQGNRIDNLQKGVNIIRLEDGKTKKVIVK